MAIKQITKFVFRRIKGRIVRIAVKTSQIRQQGLEQTKRELKSTKSAFSLWKMLKRDVGLRRKLYKPGGPLDPKKQSLDDIAAQKARDKAWTEELAKKYSAGKTDELSKFRGKKQAEKTQKLASDLWNMIGGEKKVAASLGEQQIRKKLMKGLSKEEFMEVMNELNWQRKVPRSVYESATELFDRYGEGIARFKRLAKERKWYGRKLMEEIRPQVPKAPKIHQKVNLRGKGVKFVMKNGKIQIIRPKRGK